MNSNLTTRKEYFVEVGQRIYEEHRQKCRKPFKIAKAEEFVECAEENDNKRENVAGFSGRLREKA